MPCIPCIENGRTCDEQRPVCQTCKDNQEIFCRWSLRSSDTRLVNQRISGALRCLPPTENLISRTMDGNEEYRRFIADPQCRHLLDSDGDLQHLLALANPRGNAGQMTAALAVLTMNLRHQSPHWEAAAIDYYTTTVASISASVLSPQKMERWKDLAVSMSLANAFERYDQKSEQRYIHLAGIRDLIRRSPSCGLHPLAVPCSVVKSLIYYTAIGSTFSFHQVAQEVSFWYISDLRRRVLESPNHHGDLDIHMGVPMQILEIIFQIACIRDQSSSTMSPDLIDRLIKKWRTLLETDNIVTSAARTRPIHQLFRLSCLIFLAKVEQPSLIRDDVRQLYSEAWQVLTSLDVAVQSPMLSWPLLVMFFAGNRQERDYIRILLQMHAQLFNMRRYQLIGDFMAYIERSHGSSLDDAAIFNVLLEGDVAEITLL